MPVNEQNPIPLYRQIADSIRADILAGRLTKGERLGSHQDLVRRHGVSLSQHRGEHPLSSPFK